MNKSELSTTGERCSNGHIRGTPKKWIEGQKFGKLLVLRFVEIDPLNNSHSLWECVCECGATKTVRGNYLRTGRTKSCGCMSSTKTIGARSYKHGMSQSRLHRIWTGMKSRCSNKKLPSYRRYGARGIFVCEEWVSSFETFKDWALANGYTKELTIDRIDNDKGYSPENCRWITLAENNRNRSDCVKYDGETMAQAAARLGVSPHTISYRVQAGWPMICAFNMPVFKKKT